MSISTTIIQRIAEKEGTDVEELPPLAETIDPDALDAVADTAEVIEFAYFDYWIEIHGSTMDIHDMDDPTDKPLTGLARVARDTPEEPEKQIGEGRTDEELDAELEELEDDMGDFHS
ncbi:HalOD1 output domain-containing protein [Natrarchaeobius chitinivorans]|uniref:HalOD1 output domain-containing protein n=1 Tax=Natrarchaeobius chitinivorans TaxID=1679083 RepID=UPI001FB2711A|nr:HalOD1 output domain-containing protein [Natrarchaeobius chitinivorans]